MTAVLSGTGAAPAVGADAALQRALAELGFSGEVAPRTQTGR